MNSMSAAFGVARSGRPALMFGAVLLAVAALHVTPLRERLDGTALDLTQRVVRAVAPRPAVEDVVVIGIDEETERRFPEPFALWHKRLGEALDAIALGNPRLVALDIALPERSYDSLVPGLNAELIRGLVAAKHPDRLVVGLRLNARGKPQKIDNLLLAVVGADAVGLAYVIVDRDGTARRFEPLRGKDATTLPLLTERIAMKLGIEQRAGIVDFAAGKLLDYVPHARCRRVGARAPGGSRCKRSRARWCWSARSGPDEDAVRQPLSIASWAPGASAPPGVVLLAQTVRAMQSGRIVTELAWPALGALVAICAAVVLIGGGVWRTWTVAALLLAGVVARGVLRLSGGCVRAADHCDRRRPAGRHGPASADAVEHRRFRLAIERQFAGYVSQNLLDAIVAGNVDPRQPRRYTGLGFLFADLRGFTTMTERIPAEEVLALAQPLLRSHHARDPPVRRDDRQLPWRRHPGDLRRAAPGAGRAAAGRPRSARDVCAPGSLEPGPDSGRARTAGHGEWA